MKIYTRKGDDGTTSLWYGGRVPKNSPRTEAYGAVDAAVSALGVARALCDQAGGERESELAEDILRVQREMFVAGAELATAPEAADRLEDNISRVTEQMTEALEPVIDRYMDRVELPPKFIIPGGTPLSAALDVARTAIRFAERRIVEVRDGEGLASDGVIRYVNRASDLIWAMARFADKPDPELFSGRG